MRKCLVVGLTRLGSSREFVISPNLPGCSSWARRGSEFSILNGTITVYPSTFLFLSCLRPHGGPPVASIEGSTSVEDAGGFGGGRTSVRSLSSASMPGCKVRGEPRVSFRQSGVVTVSLTEPSLSQSARRGSCIDAAPAPTSEISESQIVRFTTMSNRSDLAFTSGTALFPLSSRSRSVSLCAPIGCPSTNAFG